MRILFAPPGAPPRIAPTDRSRVALCALAAALVAAPAANMRGERIFSANCASCHAGGGNVIMYARSKTLTKKALTRFGYDTREKMADLVRNGRGAMPNYRNTLSDEEVADVCDFVVQMSDTGWH